MPYCPKCRDEYREGFTACADCGEALVERLEDEPTEPPEPVETGSGSHGGWDEVAEAPQIFEAELIAERLREAGIEARVVDQTAHPLPANVSELGLVRVLVPLARAAEARRLLEGTAPLAEDAETGRGAPEEPLPVSEVPTAPPDPGDEPEG